MASENTQTVSGFIPDPCQQEVIEAQGGFHLVLAPPGCGKTQILTERIRYAHDLEGVAYKDMLCLTFTNRAARGMIERISQNITDDDVRDVFVGNVHRFCSKFCLQRDSCLPSRVLSTRMMLCLSLRAILVRTSIWCFPTTIVDARIVRYSTWRA